MKKHKVKIILTIIFFCIIVWSIGRLLQYESSDNIIKKIPTASYEEGLALYDREIEKHPYNYNVYFRRGMRKWNNFNYNKHNIQDAIDDYNKAIKINPMNSEYYIKKIEALKSFPDLTGALEVATKGLLYNNKNSDLLLQRANILTLLGGTGNNELALQDYNKLLKYYSGNPELYKLKGDILRSLGLLSQSAETYKKAIEIDPLYYNAYIQAANVETLSGNYYNALEYYTTLIGLKDNKYFNNSNNFEVMTIEVKNVLEEIYKGRSRIYKLLGETQKAKEDFLEGDKYCFVGSENTPCAEYKDNKDKFIE